MKKENLKKYYVFFKYGSYKVIFAESYIQVRNGEAEQIYLVQFSYPVAES